MQLLNTSMEHIARSANHCGPPVGPLVAWFGNLVIVLRPNGTLAIGLLIGEGKFKIV